MEYFAFTRQWTCLGKWLQSILLLFFFSSLNKFKKASGLSEWIGIQFKLFSNTNKELILAFIIIFSATATEFTSNTSIASIFVPIIDSLVI